MLELAVLSGLAGFPLGYLAGRPDRLAEWGRIAMEEAERAG